MCPAARPRKKNSLRKKSDALDASTPAPRDVSNGEAFLESDVATGSDMTSGATASRQCPVDPPSAAPCPAQKILAIQTLDAPDVPDALAPSQVDMVIGDYPGPATGISTLTHLTPNPLLCLRNPQHASGHQECRVDNENFLSQSWSIKT